MAEKAEKTKQGHKMQLYTTKVTTRPLVRPTQYM